MAGRQAVSIRFVQPVALLSHTKKPPGLAAFLKDELVPIEFLQLPTSRYADNQDHLDISGQLHQLRNRRNHP